MKRRAGERPSPVLCVSRSCGGNSGGRSSGSKWQFSDTLKKAEEKRERYKTSCDTESEQKPLIR